MPRRMLPYRHEVSRFRHDRRPARAGIVRRARSTIGAPSTPTRSALPEAICMADSAPLTAEDKRAELRRAALEYHEFPMPGKIAIAATKQLINQRDLALAYSPGVAAPCEEIVKDPAAAFKLHRARQPGGRDHQRHRGAGPGRHRPAGLQAGDGGQGRPVQEVRRHRRVRHRDRREGPGQAGRGDRRARAHLRRHQPRGHQGARLLLRRARAAQAHEDPGVPRRPARHRDHRGRGHPQRPEGRRARTSPRSSWSPPAPAPPRWPA